VGDYGAVPRVLSLRGPYPNPFNPSAAFELDLPAGGQVRLAVYDVGGRRVRSLEDGLAPAGRHRITWDGRDDRGRPVASGVYWLRLEAGGERRVLRGVLVR
jgi:flagellar hook assembly protein FlgD